MNIDGQVIYSGEMICEGPYFPPININSNYYISPKNKSNNTVVSLRKIINSNSNMKSYNSNDAVPLSLRSISQNVFSTLSPLHVPIENMII